MVFKTVQRLFKQIINRLANTNLRFVDLTHKWSVFDVFAFGFLNAFISLLKIIQFFVRLQGEYLQPHQELLAAILEWFLVRFYRFCPLGIPKGKSRTDSCQVKMTAMIIRIHISVGNGRILFAHQKYHSGNRVWRCMCVALLHLASTMSPRVYYFGVKMGRTPLEAFLRNSHFEPSRRRKSEKFLQYLASYCCDTRLSTDC